MVDHCRYHHFFHRLPRPSIRRRSIRPRSRYYCHVRRSPCVLHGDRPTSVEREVYGTVQLRMVRRFHPCGCGDLWNQLYQERHVLAIPIILQSFTCLIVVCCIFFVPESPRWLMAQGREEEAYAFLVKYHGNGNANSQLVALEIEEFKEQISISGADKVWWDCKSLRQCV